MLLDHEKERSSARLRHGGRRLRRCGEAAFSRILAKLAFAMPILRKCLPGERLLVQGVEGQFLSGEHEAGRHARVLRRAAADGGDQQHLLPDAEGHGSGELVTANAGELPLRHQGVAPHHALRASRPKRRATRSSTSTAISPRSAKRGPVLYQLPPFLKKDLAGYRLLRCCLRDTRLHSNSATTPGSTTRSTPP